MVTKVGGLTPLGAMNVRTKCNVQWFSYLSLDQCGGPSKDQECYPWSRAASLARSLGILK